MAQEADTATWDLKPWAGTIDQLQRAARVCAERVAEAVPYPEDHDSENVRFGSKSYQADAAREIAISVFEDEGFQRTLNAIDDLDEIRADHLARVGLLEIDIGSQHSSPCSARITASRRNGVEVRVRGRNRAWTAGLKHEMQDVLKPIARLGLPGTKDKNALSGVVLAATTSITAANIYLLVKYGEEDWSIWVAAGLFIAVIAAQLLVIVIWKLPTMELLAPGQQPTYQRWRRRIFTAFGALMIGIVGSVIAAVIWP